MPDIPDKNDYPRGEHDDLRNLPKKQEPRPVEIDKIKTEANSRAKKLPLVQRVVKFFSKDKDTFRELIINSEPLERRTALLTNGVLEKYDLERTDEKRVVGAIYKGKIQNLEKGLKAAFVDVGEQKNAFLHYWDMLPAANDSSIEFIRDNESAEQKSRRERYATKDIPELFPIGSEIVVQVTKGQIGSKGPRTTTNIAIPGRFIVLMPFSGQCGISRKIENGAERDRLKQLLRKLTIPEGMGVIIRTAGEGKKLRYFVRDLHMLLKKWAAICNVINNTQQPCMLYQEPNIIERTVRDFLTEDIDRILVDNEKDYKAVLELVEEISPRSKSKVALYKDNIPIFERYNIERQIEQTYARRVPLKSGGEIVIDETEALTAIDVNTSGHKGDGDAKDFIVQANIEAVREAARQIRLRNLGGLIIIDTVDMKNPKDRKTVYNALRDAMEEDRAKHQILPISQLGIIQMSRQRQQESNTTSLYMVCPYCQGRGIVKNARAISVEIQRRIVSVTRKLRNDGNNLGKRLEFRVFLHPLNLERLRTIDRNSLIDLENAYNIQLSFRSDPNYHVENFKVIDMATGNEVR